MEEKRLIRKTSETSVRFDFESHGTLLGEASPIGPRAFQISNVRAAFQFEEQ